jgi:hypothetical protein
VVFWGRRGCATHLLHCVAVVDGLVVFLLFLRFICFFDFLVHIITILAVIAFISFVVFFLSSFSLSFSFFFLFFLLYFRLVLGIGGDGKCLGLALWVHRDIGMDDIPRH